MPDVSRKEMKRSPIFTLINATTFDDDPTSENSAAIDVSKFRKFLLTYSLEKANTPTDIVLQVQFSDDGGTTWFDYTNDFYGDLRFDDTAVGSGIKEAVQGDIGGRLFRLAVTATGTDQTDTFTLTAKVEFYD